MGVRLFSVAPKAVMASMCCVAAMDYLAGRSIGVPVLLVCDANMAAPLHSHAESRHCCTSSPHML